MTNKLTVTKINTYLKDALNSSCEGIMVKSLDVDAGYCPSKRSDSWLKVVHFFILYFSLLQESEVSWTEVISLFFPPFIDLFLRSNEIMLKG